MKLDAVIRALQPRAVFRISRGHRREVRNVFVRLTDGEGICGFGEASPNAFYGESAEKVLEKLQSLAPWLRDQNLRELSDIEQIWNDAWQRLQPSRAAQCALDLALWDLLAKRLQHSVCELSLGAPPRDVATFCTIGISEPHELAAKVEELKDFPFLKIKLDSRADLSVVKFVRERCKNARLAVDANCAWSEFANADIAAISRELARLGVEFIEQPLPPDEHARMPEILKNSALPIFADESCVTRDDVEKMPALFSGFNIKLVKCGGLTPALAMLRRGRALGLRVMVGCMLESSALIAAGAVIAQQTDFADLDGAWLIGDDPFRGWIFERGKLRANREPGLGIEPSADVFAEIS